MATKHIDIVPFGGSIAPFSGGMTIPKPFAQNILLLHTYITGMFFIDGITTLLEPIENKAQLTLVREPENKYDSKAIVIKDNKGNKLGYVPRKDNAVIANLMDAGKLIYAIVVDNCWYEVRPKVKIDLFMED